MDTSTFTVDNIGDPEPIRINANCRTFHVRENGAATTDFNIRAPYKTSPPVRYAAGQEYRAHPIDGRGSFIAGDVPGYIETIAGSVTFRMVCE